jgi:hypothetical protein
VSNGIDFVIRGKNLAGQAFDSIVSGFDSLGRASQGYAKSFATITRGLTSGLNDLTIGFAKSFSSMTRGLSASIASLSDGMTKSISNLAKGLASSFSSLAVGFGKYKTETAKAAAVTAKAEHAMRNTEKQVGRTAGAVKKLVAAAGPLIAVFAAFKGVMAVGQTVRDANAAFDEQTTKLRQLETAMEMRGTGQLTAQMEATAKSLEAVTGVSDNVTRSLMLQASQMMIASDRIDDMAKAAIGLSHVTGKDASSSLSDMKAALEGNFSAFEEINPQIRFMTSHQQKLNAVLAMASTGLNQQASDMLSVSGSARRANSAMTTLSESVGKILAPIRVLMNSGLSRMAEMLTNMLAPAVEYAGSVMNSMGPILDRLKQLQAAAVSSMVTFWSRLRDAIGKLKEIFDKSMPAIGKAIHWAREQVVNAINTMIAGFTMFEVILDNAGESWELLKTAAALALTSMAENVKHTLTEVIPEYAKWFGRNFGNLFKDAFNAVITIVSNAAKIIGNMTKTMFDFIMSGGAGGMEGLAASIAEDMKGGLLNGFTAATEALPTILERQLTQKEQDLADKMAKLGGSLGDKFTAKMKSRMVGMGETLGDEFNKAALDIQLKGRPVLMTQGVQATQGRLLTRGPGTKLQQIMENIDKTVQSIRTSSQKPREVILDDPAVAALQGIDRNTKNTVQMEAVA